MSPLVKECALCLVLISRPYEGQAASMIHHLVSETCPDHYQTLPLTRLSLFDSHILLEALLKTSTLPPRVRQGIPEKAEGNPFFLEEIVRLLIEQGTIRRTNGVWQSEPDLSISELSIPPSLHALLMSRVDRLPEEPKYVLQCCAVIGPRVPYSLLRATVGAEYRAFLEQSLEELVRREFLDLEVAAEKDLHVSPYPGERDGVWHVALSTPQGDAPTCWPWPGETVLWPAQRGRRITSLPFWEGR